MLRILFIECLFSALLGAVIFRLAYAFLQRRCCAWVVALLTALLLGIGVSGVLHPYLVMSLAETSNRLIPPPWFSQLSRSLCYLAGAWLADLVVRRRERLGFGQKKDI
ncbi:hypothetical protein [Acidithiobacillus sp.]|uniref:hypothetical protein n=1 Tax=Acidithiobacillus sp. TaxID=1872118 RepID=UPI0025C45FB4|nr:hypothetical protein [Acidithiobacillus sp.]